MEIFYDQILKIKNNIVLVLFLLTLIIVSDLVLFFYFHKNIDNIEKERTNGSTIKLTEEDIIQSTPTNTSFKIDIKGEIKKPGVYEVEEKMNVQDAIQIAGGLTKKASTDSINLSKSLKSEMVIVIPKKSSGNQEKLNNTSNFSSSDSKQLPIENDALITEDSFLDDSIRPEESVNSIVSINNANLEELKSLPGIGESKAKAIIQYRETNTFKTIDEIKNVPGIGDSLFEKIKDLITI